MDYKNDYITLDIAELLRDTDFKEETVFHWFKPLLREPELVLNYSLRQKVAAICPSRSSFQYPAPTWTMFFDWLESKGFYVHDYHLEDNTYGADLYTKEGNLIYSRAVKREPWPLGFSTRLEAWNNIGKIALKLLNESN